MIENEVELDTTLKIRKLERQVREYKRAFEAERIWRYAFWVVGFMVVCKTIYDIWNQ